MSLLDPALMQRMGRSRLVTSRSTAYSGIGERHSKGKGPGIEFADHRDYQLGDDIRYLDSNVYSRLGRHVIRQFTLYRQLPVTILLDGSSSMSFGQPPKLRRGQELAAALAYVSLAGGDRVLVGIFDETGIRWHPQVEGAQRSAMLLSWLEGQEPTGAADLPHVARTSGQRLPEGGILVVISDWLSEQWKPALQLWHAAGQELVGVHLLAPQELEPELLGSGLQRVIDVETGHEVEAPMDEVHYRRYREELQQWRDEIRAGFRSLEGRYFFTRSDEPLERLLLSKWRTAGLIR